MRGGTPLPDRGLCRHVRGTPGRGEKILRKIGRFFCNFKNNSYFCHANAKVAQLVEHNLPKVRVAGSSPVFRSLPQAVSDFLASLILFLSSLSFCNPV